MYMIVHVHVVHACCFLSSFCIFINMYHVSVDFGGHVSVLATAGDWSAGLVYFLSPALAPGGQLPDTLVVLSTVVLRLGGYTGWECGGRERGMHLLKEVTTFYCKYIYIECTVLHVHVYICF